MYRGIKGSTVPILSLLLFFLCGTLPLAAETSVVTIESAQNTSYYTDELTEDEIIVFTGDVVISVVQGASTSRIKASQVNFNRTKNLLYAQGNVSLERNSGTDVAESLTSESLLFNINTEEGIFDSGTVVHSDSDAIKLDTNSKMVVSADLFASDDSGTIAFRTGTLTFCEEPDPHWKIRASRIWLLPSNEFAFANALLYIGKVPIMYFPFFYYPKDELIFNPVFGYDQRKGYFFQTTTYLIGRKIPSEKKDEDSFFSFLNSSTMYKQQREGLVLRNLTEKDTNSYPHSLKFMADYYSNLGGMVGITGDFKPADSNISKLDFSLNLGFSRTLFPVVQGGVSVYVPYDEKGNSYYNNSVFAGVTIPFRYRGHFSMTMSRPFSLSLDLPLYSDPFFNQDFLSDRNETMDWFDFLMSNGSGDVSSTTTTTGEVSSFVWKVSASFSPEISMLNPYVSSISFSPKFDLNFHSLTDTSNLTLEEAKVSPNRKTFYPGRIKPFYFNVSISGTLFEYPIPEKIAVSENTSQKKLSKNEFNVPHGFLTEEEIKAREEKELALQNGAEESEEGLGGETGEMDGMENQESTEEEDIDALQGLSIPRIAVSTPSVSSLGGLKYKLSYSISPDFSSEIDYNVPETADSFEWTDINSTFFSVRIPTTLTSDLGYRDYFIGLKNTLTFSPVYQRHPIYKNESREQTIKQSDYIAQKMDLSNSNTLTFTPFVYNPIFSDTNVSWNTNVRVIRTQFVGTVEEPEWEYKLPAWNNESFTAHRLSFNYKSQQGSFYQQLTYNTVLPPLRESHTTTLTLGFPMVNASLGVGVQRKSIDDREWISQPLNQSLSVSLLEDKLKFSQSYSYNLEDKHNENFNLQLSGYGFTAVYGMRYEAGYDYDQVQGWKIRSTREFQPTSLELRYSYSPGDKINFWKNRISLAPGISTAIHYDFLRPTNSYFTFSPSISFTINEFMSLNFSVTTRNDVIYRYIQNLTDFEPKIPGEENILIDLWNSFSFWDEEKRKASGFKLKSLDVSLSHELHDWTLSSTFKIFPRIISEGGKRFYDFSPHFTLSVVWKPMNSMKTTIEDKYGTVTLNP